MDTSSKPTKIHDLNAFFLAILLLLLTGMGEAMSQKTNGKAEQGAEEQALIVQIRLSDDNHGKSEEREKILKLEEELLNALSKSGSGEYDGNEIGGGFFTLYMYGPSAARLWDVAAPVLKRFRVPVGSYAIKRYGKPGAKQDRISLSD